MIASYGEIGTFDSIFSNCIRILRRWKIQRRKNQIRAVICIQAAVFYENMIIFMWDRLAVAQPCSV